MADIWKDIPEVVRFLYQAGSIVALPVIVWLYNRLVSHNKQISSETVLQAANVRAAIAISEKLTSEKLATIASAVSRTTEVAEETHQIVNGAKAILLEEIVNLKLKIAEITKDPNDYKLAEVARERLRIHLDTLLVCRRVDCPDRSAVDTFVKWEKPSDIVTISPPQKE